MRHSLIALAVAAVAAAFMTGASPAKAAFLPRLDAAASPAGVVEPVRHYRYRHRYYRPYVRPYRYYAPRPYYYGYRPYWRPYGYYRYGYRPYYRYWW